MTMVFISYARNTNVPSVQTLTVTWMPREHCTAQQQQNTVTNSLQKQQIFNQAHTGVSLIMSKLWTTLI